MDRDTGRATESSNDARRRRRAFAAGRLPLEYRFSALLLGTLLLTNRYLSSVSDASLVYFAGADTYSYLSIAKAFPLLPTRELAAHLAQRLGPPYLLGGLAWLTGVSAEAVFALFAALAILGIILAFHRILDRLGLPREMKMVVLSLLILNTYVFRYYVAIPWMLSDLVFQLGLAGTLLGLLGASPALTLVSLLTSALGKQTALFALPGVIAWIWYEWTTFALRVRIRQCLAMAIACVGAYAATVWLARPFSGPGVVAIHALGLVRWVATDASPTMFLIFLLRGVIGFALPVALVLGLMLRRRLPVGWHRKRKLALSLFLTGSILLQPLLGGPEVTGQSATRLAMLAYLPLLVGLGTVLTETSLSTSALRRLVFLCAFVVGMSSFHHFYSFLGLWDVGRAGRFVLVYLGSALLLFVGVLALEGPEEPDDT